MSDYPVNNEKVFYNYGGKIPPLVLDEKPVETTKAHSGGRKIITDTTLRDGAQDSRLAIFPNEAKVKYFDLLHKLDNGTGVIDCVETFIYQKRDLWVLEEILSRGYEYPRVTTWTRAVPKDIKDLVTFSNGRLKETGMLASSSDHHIFDKLRFHSKEEAIEKYLQPIMTAYDSGILPRVHLEDTTRADIYGWVLPFMQRVLRETNGTAKFRICDTIGMGSPDPFAALPMGVPRLTRLLKDETGAELEYHGHNDFGMATANSLSFWEYGGTKVNCVFGGLGERSGNTSLEQVLTNYVRIYGDPGFNLHALAEIADLIDNEVRVLPQNAPIVGDVFSSQAGLHQTGLHRQQEAEGGYIYLAYDPLEVGRGEQELQRVGHLSGMDGIISLLNKEHQKRTGQSGGYAATNRSIKYVYDKVHEAYDGRFDEGNGTYVDWRRTFFSAEELYDLAQEYERDHGRA